MKKTRQQSKLSENTGVIDVIGIKVTVFGEEKST